MCSPPERKSLSLAVNREQKHSWTPCTGDGRRARVFLVGVYYKTAIMVSTYLYSKEIYMFDILFIILNIQYNT